MTTDWPTVRLTALRRGQFWSPKWPPRRPPIVAWIAVYPLRSADGAPVFNLFHREFDRAYLDNDWCIGPDDGMIEVRQAQAVDELQLTQILAAWKVAPSDFTFAHRTEYPV